MNWLLMIVVGMIIIGALVGAARGALRITVSIVATALTLFLVVLVTPYVSRSIVALTPVDELIESECLKMVGKAMTGKASGGLSEEQVRKIIRGAGTTEEELEAKGITIEDIVKGRVSDEKLRESGISPKILDGHTVTTEDIYNIFTEDIPRTVQIETIEKSKVPKAFKELLISNNNDEVYQRLGAQTFAEYVGRYFARLMINIVAFVLTFLIVTIIVRALIFALDIVAELPGLGLLNRMGGAVLGMAMSVVVVEFMFVAITMVFTSSLGEEMLGLIEGSKILTYFYENNVIMDLMTRLW